MKRSELNTIIGNAIDFVTGRGVHLPPFAFWRLPEWQKLRPSQAEIVDNMLGWDITDFGTGDFEKYGLLIFTFRNGNFKNKVKYPKPYAEKLLLVGDGQELPFHFHWKKMEDIINRGGGNVLIDMFDSTKEEKFSDKPVRVSVDGEELILQPGGQVKLTPGQSITLLPGQYHRITGERGTGQVILFEVSTLNDDTVDNRFYSAKGRFPEIEEDTEPEYLIFRDYEKYARFI